MINDKSKGAFRGNNLRLVQDLEGDCGILIFMLEDIATASFTMGKLIAGIVIAIVGSSGISVDASALMSIGPQGEKGVTGETVTKFSVKR
jgi:hypothetical protein